MNNNNLYISILVRRQAVLIEPEKLVLPAYYPPLLKEKLAQGSQLLDKEYDVITRSLASVIVPITIHPQQSSCELLINRWIMAYPSYDTVFVR